MSPSCVFTIKQFNPSRIALIQVVFLWLLVSSDIYAQDKEITMREQIWVGYFNQTRLTNRWGLWFDAHARLLDLPHLQNLNFVRPGLTYYLNDNLRITAGYSYLAFSLENNPLQYTSEHRPWQQIWFRQKLQGYSMLQWIRLEQRYKERFLNDQPQNTFELVHRIRYNLYLSIPLNHSELIANTWFIGLQDEIFLNLGSNVYFNTFDQNRFFVGFGYAFNKDLNIQVGYMNVFQQRNQVASYFDSHCLRVFIFHTLDFRKNE